MNVSHEKHYKIFLVETSLCKCTCMGCQTGHCWYQFPWYVGRGSLCKRKTNAAASSRKGVAIIERAISWELPLLVIHGRYSLARKQMCAAASMKNGVANCAQLQCEVH